MLVACNDYFFFAGYVVLPYIVLATAWYPRRLCRLHHFARHCRLFRHRRLLVGGCTSFWGPLILVLIVVGGVPGLVGLGMGCPRPAASRGVFFAIGTLALAIVVQTFVTNWDFVGGARGVYIIRPATALLLGSCIHSSLLVMLALAGFRSR